MLERRYGDGVRGRLATRAAGAGGARHRARSRDPGVALAVLLFAAPILLGAVISEVLGTVMVFALLGLGLNIVVGYAGLLDLGYVFFFTLGAYSLALLTGATLNTFVGSSRAGGLVDLNFYVAIPIVVLIAAGAGVLIGAPVLRLRGDYLALVTLGLGEMIVVLVRSPWLEPLVGGPRGCATSPTPRSGASGSEIRSTSTTSRSRSCARPVRVVAPRELPRRPGVDRAARRRAGRRRDGRQHH